MSEAIEVATKYLSSRAGGRVVSSKKWRLQSVVSILWSATACLWLRVLKVFCGAGVLCYIGSMRKSTSGFTIVELLIVIVVIAVLAAISIVAYTGIQQRANNTKTIAAANQVVKAISAYIAANETYPSTGISCVVPSSTSACTIGNTTNRATDATLINNLQTISTLPSTPVMTARDTYDGITYYYRSTRTVDGNAQPLAIVYSLNGSQQQPVCLCRDSLCWS